MPIVLVISMIKNHRMGQKHIELIVINYYFLLNLI